METTTKIDERNTAGSRQDLAAEFINALGQLDVGQLAALKRAAGSNIGSNWRATCAFYTTLPYQLKKHENELFIVATCYATMKGKQRAGSFGSTMRAVKKEGGSDSMDRRFDALMESKIDTGELAHRMVQLTRLSASKEVGIDWKQLAFDIMTWDRDDKRVQKKWAYDYYGTKPEA